MPGIACKFTVLQESIKRFEESGDAHLMGVATILGKHLPYSNLGVIGPAIGDFLPADSTNPYCNIWTTIFEVMGDELSINVQDRQPGLLHRFAQIERLIDGLEQVANDERTTGLQDFEHEANDVSEFLRNTNFDDLVINQLYNPIASLIRDEMKPSVNVPPGNRVDPQNRWKVRDYLCWKKSGRFARSLLVTALAEVEEEGISDEERTEREKWLAYAYGYVISYVVHACASSFENSIVGGPYRTQWWRHRWVSNYIDAWVHGYYSFVPSDRPNMDLAADKPDAEHPYESWANLCGANLQQHIELPETEFAYDAPTLMKAFYFFSMTSADPPPLPSLLPDRFGEFWLKAFEEAYTDETTPSCFDIPDPSIINDAYILIWLVLWFQTSREVCEILGPRDVNISPPDNCAEPPWSIAGATPPSPAIVGDIEPQFLVASTVFHILAIFFGWLTLVSGIVRWVQGTPNEEEWRDFRCDLFWYRMFLYRTIMQLHQALTMYALSYPYPGELAQGVGTFNPNTFDPNLPNFIIAFDTGWSLVRSRGPAQVVDFPWRPLDQSELTPFCQNFTWFYDMPRWISHPRNQQLICNFQVVEMPQTIAYLDSRYPNFLIDNEVENSLDRGDVKTKSEHWPQRVMSTPDGVSRPVQFGNVLANVSDLFSNLGANRNLELPDWNLDGDRGLAYLTWEFDNGLYTPNQGVQLTPES